MTKLISSYTAYVKRKAEIRQRQRAELADELFPYLKSLGEAIVEAQGKGKRIEDIEYEIGAKNRTLVYAAKRATKGLKSEPKVETPKPDSEPPEKRWAVATNGWNDFGDTRVWQVRIDGAYVGEVIESFDEMILPDNWAADRANQPVYREIVAHIRGSNG